MSRCSPETSSKAFSRFEAGTRLAEGGALLLRKFHARDTARFRLAAPFGLHPVLKLHRDSAQAANRAAGVTWTTLALVKAAQP